MTAIPDLRPPFGTGVRVRGASMIEYAYGAGGRIFDMAPSHLDMLVEAILDMHPARLPDRVCELLVSGRFRRSRHPQLRDLTLTGLRQRNLERSNRLIRRQRELHPPRRLHEDDMT